MQDTIVQYKSMEIYTHLIFLNEFLYLMEIVYKEVLQLQHTIIRIK